MSGRNPPSYCTLTLIAMQGHQQKGRQNNTSSNNKDKSNTIIETSTAEDHDDENLHNPSTRPRYSPGSRRRAVGDHTLGGKSVQPGKTAFLLYHGCNSMLYRNYKLSVYYEAKLHLRRIWYSTVDSTKGNRNKRILHLSFIFGRPTAITRFGEGGGQLDR